MPIEGGCDGLVVGDCDVLLEVGPLEGGCDGLRVGSIVVVLNVGGVSDGILEGDNVGKIEESLVGAIV